jgi:hypothetical protein
MNVVIPRHLMQRCPYSLQPLEQEEKAENRILGEGNTFRRAKATADPVQEPSTHSPHEPAVESTG